jgi:pheromone a factor receptor
LGYLSNKSTEIISEGHRFNIFQEIGCYPYTYNTWVAILTVSVPPIIIGVVSAVYAFLSIRALYQTRAQSRAILSVYSNLNSGRYLRLMALSACEILGTIPLAIYAMHLNLENSALRPWISWADTHSGYSRVDQIPSLLWRSNPIVENSLEMTRWLCVACALLFFGFFGFADEARSRYRSAASTIVKHLGISTNISSSTIYVSQYVLCSHPCFQFIDLPTRMSKAGTGSESIIGASEKCNRKTSSDFSLSNQNQSSDHLPPANTPTTNGKKSHNLSYAFGKKKFNEEVFKSTFCYDDLVLPDIGGTLADNELSETPPVPASGSSSTSNTPVPQHTIPLSEASGTDMPSSTPSFISEEPRKSHNMV